MMASGMFVPAEAPLWREAERARPGICATLQAQGLTEQLPPISGMMQAVDREHGTTTKGLRSGYCFIQNLCIPDTGTRR